MQTNQVIQKLVAHMPEHYDLDSMQLRKSAYYQAYAENPQAPQPVKVALGFRKFLQEKPVILYEYDVLAGLIQHYDVSASMAVSYNEGYDPRVLPIYTRSTDVPRQLGECKKQKAFQPEELACLDALLQGNECGLYNHNPYGHVIPGFSKVIHLGFDRLLQSIEARRQQPLTPAQSDYLRAMEIVLTAASDYFARYGQAARALAEKAAEDTQRENLLRIAQSCARTAKAGAETFFDAVQMATILQELVTIETASGSMSLGRMDQLFYEYYQKDPQITYDRAQLIIDAWRIKLAGLIQGFQNVVICGSDQAGNFAGNEVSLMILRSARRLRFDQPLLSMRCTGDMPDIFWEEAMDLIELGDGFPALFNDELIIASREKMGVSPEHAWDFGIVGCVEPSICGKEFSNTEEMRLNWLKILELMFHDGKCAQTGRSFQMSSDKKLRDIGSYEALVDWFKEELVNFIRQAAKGCDLVDSVYYRCFPSPMLSATMEGCIDNACDVADANSTLYRFSTINNCGMSNVVDSLLAVKKLVFEDHRLSLTELQAVLDGDFEGYEDIYQIALNRCEKFGNDTRQANELMKQLMDLASQTINAIPNCRGYHFQTGMYSVDQHASFGAQTWASPEGRKNGASLANGASPVQGMDREGPTAVINAMTAFDHTQFGNGMVLDLKFNQSLFRHTKHRPMFRMLVETYFQKGGMEIQFNVVDKATLLDAQANPSKHKNLIVRVSGFSAYFVNLFKALQDEIIARTENGGF